MKYWSNFARNGWEFGYFETLNFDGSMLNLNWILGSAISRNPNSEGLVEWPSYGLNEEYLKLNLEQRKSEKLRNTYVDFWLKALPEKMKTIIEEEKTYPEL